MATGKAVTRRDEAGGGGWGTSGATGVDVSQHRRVFDTARAVHKQTDSVGRPVEAVLAVWCIDGTEDTAITQLKLF